MGKFLDNMKESGQIAGNLTVFVKTKRNYKIEELFELMEKHIENKFDKFGKMVLEERDTSFLGKLGGGGDPVIIVKGAVQGNAITVSTLGKSIFIQQITSCGIFYDEHMKSERNKAEARILSVYRANVENANSTSNTKITTGEVAYATAAFVADEAKGCASGCLGMIPGFGILIKIFGFKKNVQIQNDFYNHSKGNVAVIQSLREEIEKFVEMR